MGYYKTEVEAWRFRYRQRIKLKADRRSYWVNKYKQAKGCCLCGYRLHPVALDFDHLNPLEKEFNLHKRNIHINLKRYMNEVRKCRILCSNCHRIETHVEGGICGI